ncbi:probable serine/threonine-protein kinase yakA [Pecten maximus]|uniref:probable serine/threonine-protein kinase yakA n=1 Tax=Pecten maximus TaxID=6579 RepID=UPI001458F10B|nr:probable serine/threonine-protein kinase yakA [Pecten maximus]
MDRNSAFRKEICHKGQHIPLDPPIVHMSAYTKGGLHRLFRQIAHPEKVSFPMYEYGQFTDEAGQFCPVLGVVMASRYRVRQVISRQGQSAVLLLAEDLFCHKKHVVIKVLHASRYQLGAQETQCLWRLALADPWGNSNTVHYLNTFTFDDHYCIVFKPLVPLSLTDIFQDIPAQKIIHSIRKIAVRLLSTLGFLRQQNVIHADLKPENILLRDRNDLSSVTVIDFGNAIQHVHKEIALYYDDFELQTPLYRAPEVMFGMPFGKEIDMWSLGCILAELYLSKPLFMGNSKMDIMKQITSLLGPFPGRTFQRGKFYSSFKHFTDKVEQPDATELLQNHLGCRDYLLADFLSGLLRYNPDERMTPFEAAKHSFLAPEFPFGYLLPPSSDNGSVSYSAVHLNSTKYKHRPTVAADIRRSQPSTYDILSLGTALKEEEEEEESPLEGGDTPNKYGKVAKVVPVQREQSLGKDQRGSGEVTRQQNSGRNQVTTEITRKGLSHVQKVRKGKAEQNCSPNLINQESTLRDTRREQRDLQDHKEQWETNRSTDIQRRREACQNQFLAKKRREIEKELLVGHRTREDQYYNPSLSIEHPSTGRCGPAGRSETINPSLSIEHPSTGRCAPAERSETINPCSPADRKTGKTEVSNNMNSNRVNSHSTRNREERRRFDMSPVKEQQSLMGGNTMWKNRVVRNVTQQEPVERSQNSGNDQFQSTSEDEKLTREDALPHLRRHYRGREVTPNGHINQNISWNAGSIGRCYRYDSQAQELQSNHEERKLSRSQSDFKDMNETFVINSDSDYSTTFTHRKSQCQNKRQSPDDQKNEIIRPCPGWFSRKQDNDGSCKYNDSMSEEHLTVRRSIHQNPTAESQVSISRELKSNSDSVRSEYEDRLPGKNTHSLDQQCNHIKQTQTLDTNGKMKHTTNFCPQSPGYGRKKLMLIPPSPVSLSQESVNFQSDSERPSPYKQYHQESPKQQTKNGRQLASLMKAIREQQDLAEYDMSEKESDQQFEVESRTARDQRIKGSRNVRLPKKCMSTSKMYDSVSEDEIKSFEESLDGNGHEINRKSRYNNSTFETIVRPLTQFPSCNNLEKRQDYQEQRRNPAFTSNVSNKNVKEEKYFKTDEASTNRVAHWKKKHLRQSSPDVVSTSRQNFVCDGDNTEDSQCPVNQKSANTHKFSPEAPNVSSEEPKHLKIKAKCESGSRAQSQVYNADMCGRASNDAGNNFVTLDQNDRKEVVTSEITCRNHSRVDEETVSSKTQNRKTLKIYDHNTDKLSDHDITRKECKIPSSQKICRIKIPLWNPKMGILQQHLQSLL